MLAIASELLLSAYQLTPDDTGDTFEFILNYHLEATECRHLENKIPKQAFSERLGGALFELKHVRVNPALDNRLMIQQLVKQFNKIGVTVFNQPTPDSMAMCYRPIGEISATIRFYLQPNGTVIFLSPTTRPKLIHCLNDC